MVGPCENPVLWACSCIPAKGKKSPTFHVKLAVCPEVEGVTFARREVTFARWEVTFARWEVTFARWTAVS